MCALFAFGVPRAASMRAELRHFTLNKWKDETLPDGDLSHL